MVLGVNVLEVASFTNVVPSVVCNGPVCCVHGMQAHWLRRPALPSFNEGSIRIVLLCLLVQIELPEAPWVSSDACQILPVAVVAGDIVIHQLLFKPGGTVAPVQLQFMHETTGDQLPGPVAHVAGFAQLVHGGVDDGVLSVSFTPGLKTMAIEGHLPMLALHAIPAEQAAAVFERVPVEVFTPE